MRDERREKREERRGNREESGLVCALPIVLLACACYSVVITTKPSLQGGGGTN